MPNLWIRLLHSIIALFVGLLLVGGFLAFCVFALARQLVKH